MNTFLKTLGTVVAILLLLFIGLLLGMELCQKSLPKPNYATTKLEKGYTYASYKQYLAQISKRVPTHGSDESSEFKLRSAHD